MQSLASSCQIKTMPLRAISLATVLTASLCLQPSRIQRFDARPSHGGSKVTFRPWRSLDALARDLAACSRRCHAAGEQCLAMQYFTESGVCSLEAAADERLASAPDVLTISKKEASVGPPVGVGVSKLALQTSHHSSTLTTSTDQTIITYSAPQNSAADENISRSSATERIDSCIGCSSSSSSESESVGASSAASTAAVEGHSVARSVSETATAGTLDGHTENTSATTLGHQVSAIEVGEHTKPLQQENYASDVDYVMISSTTDSIGDQETEADSYSIARGDQQFSSSRTLTGFSSNDDRVTAHIYERFAGVTSSTTNGYPSATSSARIVDRAATSASSAERVSQETRPSDPIATHTIVANPSTATQLPANAAALSAAASTSAAQFGEPSAAATNFSKSQNANSAATTAALGLNQSMATLSLSNGVTTTEARTTTQGAPKSAPLPALINASDGHIVQSVSVGLAGVWALSSTGTALYRLGTYGNASSEGTGWREIAGVPAFVDLRSGVQRAYGISSTDSYLTLTLDPTGSSAPSSSFCSTYRIRRFGFGSANESKFYGLSLNGHLFVLNGSYFTACTKVSFCGYREWMEMTCGPSGLWMLASNGSLFYLNNSRGAAPFCPGTWLNIPGTFATISTAGDFLLAVAANGTVVSRKGISSTTPVGSSWQSLNLNISAVDVSISSSGVAWLVGRSGDVSIFRYH